MPGASRGMRSGDRWGDSPPPRLESRRGRCAVTFAGMALLEREPLLQAVEGYLAEAAAGRGRLVFVAGEAGVGKTAFVSRVLSDAASSTTVTVGSCDGSSTPAPLGPLVEMLPDLPSDVWSEGAARHEVFARLSSVLRQSSRPHLLVIEDAHWADEATLDLVRYLARRVHQMRALVLVTYRAEEAAPDHPLRVLLGDVATSVGIRRADLSPLSVAAVRTLVEAASGGHAPEAATATAESRVDPEELHRVTGGNPFYVTEVLAVGGTSIPRSVRDAVLSRTARLSQPARLVLDLVALAGPRTEVELLQRLAPGCGDALDEAIDRGVLLLTSGVLMFRHELARRTVREQVPALRRMSLHRGILAELEADPGADPARMAYHAEAGGLPEAVNRHATEAAVRAVALGAHREAAEQLRRVLDHADHEQGERRAVLLGQLSYELYVTDRIEDGLAARREALAIWERLGERHHIGEAHRWLSRLSWFAGDNAHAERHGILAVETLAGTEDSAFAMACSNMAQLRMLAGDLEGTRHWGSKALRLLERLPETPGATEARLHALGNVGTAELDGGNADLGLAMLEESLRRARAADLHEHAGRAFCNLAAIAVRQHRHHDAEVVLKEGLEYCVERDLDAWSVYLRGWEALQLAERGKSEVAALRAEALLRQARLAVVSQIVPLSVLARARARTGRGDWLEPLGRAQALAERTGEAQRLGTVAAAGCEIAWLAGDFSEASRVAEQAWEVVQAETSPWIRGNVATWLRPELARGTAGLAPPYALEVAGRWREAAQVWAELGSGFAEALALARSGTRDGLGAAALLFEGMGAVTAAARARALSRARGWAPPRGPHAATREHPKGLTLREAEVLPLLTDGLSDAAIAEHLVISRRTVEHHVASILGKLGLTSRRDVPAFVAEQCG
jgi:DNA-binding CsgD family transcriptional regulator